VHDPADALARERALERAAVGDVGDVERSSTTRT